MSESHAADSPLDIERARADAERQRERAAVAKSALNRLGDCKADWYRRQAASGLDTGPTVCLRAVEATALWDLVAALQGRLEMEKKRTQESAFADDVRAAEIRNLLTAWNLK